MSFSVLALTMGMGPAVAAAELAVLAGLDRSWKGCIFGAVETLHAVECSICNV